MIIDDLLSFEWLLELEIDLEGLGLDDLPPQLDLQPDPDIAPPDWKALPQELVRALSGELPGDDDPFLEMDHAALGPEALRAALTDLRIVNPFQDPPGE